MSFRQRRPETHAAIGDSDLKTPVVVHSASNAPLIASPTVSHRTDLPTAEVRQFVERNLREPLRGW